MKVFSLTLNLESLSREERENTTEKEVLTNLLFGALSSANPQGIDMQGQRLLNKILDKIEESSSLKEVKLEDAEFEFLSKSFKTGKFRPHIYKLINQVYDAIEACK